MNAIVEATALGKRYRGRWALQGCSLSLPAGRVIGLVGPNGAGKSTLLNLAAGLLTPTTGSIEVCGAAPARDTAQLAKVGFVAQDTPLYPTLSVADHLTLGARLNPRWDGDGAARRVQQLRLLPKQKTAKLSGGQRAQLALTLALARRPELLLLDEPVASLDPLARREFLAVLMEAVAEREVTVVLSSHVVSDLERVCDHLVVLADSQVRAVGDVDTLLATHHRLTGARRNPASMPKGTQVVTASHTDRQTTLVVRTDGPVLDPGWAVSQLGLEDLVLAYMTGAADTYPTRALEVLR